MAISFVAVVAFLSGSFLLIVDVVLCSILGVLLCLLKEQWVTCLLTAAAWEVQTHTRMHKGDVDEEIAAPLVPEDLSMHTLYRTIVDELDLDR